MILSLLAFLIVPLSSWHIFFSRLHTSPPELQLFWKSFSPPMLFPLLTTLLFLNIPYPALAQLSSAHLAGVNWAVTFSRKSPWSAVPLLKSIVSRPPFHTYSHCPLKGGIKSSCPVLIDLIAYGSIHKVWAAESLLSLDRGCINTILKLQRQQW